MLTAHFELTEHDVLLDHPDSWTVRNCAAALTGKLVAAVRSAEITARIEATRGLGDGNRPYWNPIVIGFNNAGELDSFREWCEVWKPGDGVHVGLVIEGTPSGPLYAHEGTPGVWDADVNQTLVATFARHLSETLDAADLPLTLEGTYYVTDWSLYERCSNALTW